MPVTVAHSVLNPDGLAQQVAHDYELPGAVSCSFIGPGVNDTYLVLAGAESFYYRVYRAGWRSRSDIEFELGLLLHLQNGGVDVSLPVAKRDGTYITELHAPEGVRPAVLFTRAPGKVLDYVEADAFNYGVAAAKLHSALDTYQSAFTRFHLDLDHLLEQPLQFIKPFAVHVGNWEFFAEVGARLRSRFRAVEDELEWGICHGDLHGHNVHQEDGRLTLFDVDCGGPGWRAYDLAVYRWAVSRHAKTVQPWDSFLEGYRTLREVRSADLAMVPVFVAMRTIWLLGLHASQVHQRGTSSVHMWIEGGARALQAWDDAELRGSR